MPERTALAPAVWATVIGTVSPALTVIGTLTQVPAWNSLDSVVVLPATVIVSRLAVVSQSIA
jgi:hypothetical protein